MKALLFTCCIAGLASCLQPESPEAVTVTAPAATVENTTMPDSTPVLLFVVKGKEVAYQYGIQKNTQNLKAIIPSTTAAVVEAITAAETSSSKTFGPDEIIVKGDTTLADNAGFSVLKAALKEKQYFKFRIVTTTE